MDTQSEGQSRFPPAGVLLADPACPLDEMQFLILRQAVIRLRPIRRAAGVARGSALTILIVALAGWPILLFAPSLPGLAMVGGISAIGGMEYFGAIRMRRADPL
ncbi:MAG TPA: hypothetical protein VLM89_01475, partial [Phycisphaerae bacterium]|nr:hypothetical protein [Phycisphaerae bacterium]